MCRTIIDMNNDLTVFGLVIGQISGPPFKVFAVEQSFESLFTLFVRNGVFVVVQFLNIDIAECKVGAVCLQFDRLLWKDGYRTIPIVFKYYIVDDQFSVKEDGN